MPKLLHTNNLSVLLYIRRVVASTLTTQLFCIYCKTVKSRQYCSCFDLQINIVLAKYFNFVGKSDLKRTEYKIR